MRVLIRPRDSMDLLLSGLTRRARRGISSSGGGEERRNKRRAGMAEDCGGKTFEGPGRSGGPG